jgi:hypothetical protein
VAQQPPVPHHRQAEREAHPLPRPIPGTPFLSVDLLCRPSFFFFFVLLLTPNVIQGENKSIAPKSIGFYIYESANPGQRLTSTKGLDLLCKGKFRKQKEGTGCSQG